jgi:gluconate:H+ symporter, GntP family
MVLQLLGLFAAAIVAVIGLTARLRLHPLAALLGVAFAFGVAADLSPAYTVRSMIDGFVATMATAGIALAAAAVIDTALNRSGYRDRLAAALSRLAPRGCGAAPAAIIGGIAGPAPAADVGLALLMPAVGAAAQGPDGSRVASTVACALAFFAAHSLVLPAPGPLAAATILSADLGQVLLIGLPLAAITGIVGWTFAVVATARLRATSPADEHVDASPRKPVQAGGWLSPAVLVALPIVLLLTASFASLPCEPFGRGSLRDLLVTLGRPMALLLVILAAVPLLTRRAASDRSSGSSWIAEALRDAGALAFTAAAAGAFAEVVQNAALGERIAEHVVDARFGVLVPFAIAAVVRTTSGSPVLAMITAAGFTQSLLQPLGLEGDVSRALATVAVGAGALAISHANDATFWIVTRSAGLSPAQGSRLLTLGTLVQALTAAVSLLILQAILL